MRPELRLWATCLKASVSLTLSESLRLLIGNAVLGVDITIYGLLLVLFIIYMPKGILGTLMQSWAMSPRP